MVDERPASSGTVGIEAKVHNLVLLSELPKPSVAQLVDEELSSSLAKSAVGNANCKQSANICVRLV